MKRIYFILLLSFLGILSCKKETDDVQININIENSPDKTTVNRNYTIDETRFYLSNFQLEDASGNTVLLKDLLLVKSSSNNSFTLKAPAGSFTKFNFSFGLDKATNNLDPNGFDDNNPLSTKQDMYWNMLKYRFIVTEGKLDSSIAKNKIPSVPFSMHLGSDTLYRVISTDLAGKQITKGSVINISINLNKLFVLDKDTFNITNFSNHSDVAQIPKAIAIVDSFVSGFKTDIFSPN